MLDDGAGLWYTAGIEQFISTMETSSLMGMNVARLVVDGWGEVGKGARGARVGEEVGEGAIGDKGKREGDGGAVRKEDL